MCGLSFNDDSREEREKRGGPDWYRLRKGKGAYIKPGEQVQCSRCYNRQSKGVVGEYAGLLTWRKALKGILHHPEISKVDDRIRKDKQNARDRTKRRVLKESTPKYLLQKLKGPKHCVDCGSTKSGGHKNRPPSYDWYTLKVPIGPTGYLDWNCYRKRRRRLKREAQGLPTAIDRKRENQSEKKERQNDLERARRARKKALKPKEPPEPQRRCIECGSYTTEIRKGRPRHPSDSPAWKRLGDRESAGGLYHCATCNKRHWKRRARLAKRLLKVALRNSTGKKVSRF